MTTARRNALLLLLLVLSFLTAASIAFVMRNEYEKQHEWDATPSGGGGSSFFGLVQEEDGSFQVIRTTDSVQPQIVVMFDLRQSASSYHKDRYKLTFVVRTLEPINDLFAEPSRAEAAAASALVETELLRMLAPRLTQMASDAGMTDYSPQFGLVTQVVGPPRPKPIVRSILIGTLAALLLALGGVVHRIYLVVRRARRKSRSQCIECGYPMTGGYCPECGAEFVRRALSSEPPA